MSPTILIGMGALIALIAVAALLLYLLSGHNDDRRHRPQ
jgi:hypothetical protein